MINGTVNAVDSAQSLVQAMAQFRAFEEMHTDWRAWEQRDLLPMFAVAA